MFLGLLLKNGNEIFCVVSHTISHFNTNMLLHAFQLTFLILILTIFDQLVKGLIKTFIFQMCQNGDFFFLHHNQSFKLRCFPYEFRFRKCFYVMMLMRNFKRKPTNPLPPNPNIPQTIRLFFPRFSMVLCN